jgi:hypothetical protein
MAHNIRPVILRDGTKGWACEVGFGLWGDPACTVQTRIMRTRERARYKADISIPGDYPIEYLGTRK